MYSYSVSLHIKLRMMTYKFNFKEKETKVANVSPNTFTRTESLNSNWITSNSQVSHEPQASLFNQVVARYREELKKLASDENFKPLYIGIRQAGDEIHLWALVEEKDDYTPQCLSRLEVEINRLFYNQNLLILTFYFYKGYHDCLVPDDEDYVSLHRVSQ